MCSIEEQIPIFPSHFVPENRDAIDFNAYNVIAVGCGSSINFSYVEDLKLKQAYSISVGSSYVTALKFHPSNEHLFIGDSKGNLRVFDYQKRIFISQPFQFEEHSNITQLAFLDSGLLVLNQRCTFAFLDYNTKNSSMYRFHYIWKTALPEKTTNFSVDPFRKSRIFIYGRNTNFFMILTLDKSRKSIKSASEQLFLSNNLVFQDAQFSIHIRNYIIFMTEVKFMLFNVDHSIVISIPHFQKASSFLHRFVQFPSDDSKILCFHKSGSITIFEVQTPFTLSSIAEIPFTQQDQQLFMYCLSSLRDDFLACVYSPLGVTLFDISTFKMVSILPLWSDKTTTFTTNGMNYAIGTIKGYIIYGNLYKPDEKAVFQISKKSITFLSIVPNKHLIYWATDDSIGEIDTGFRRVTIFPKHCLSTQKTVGTMTGGFMVQRESCVLGLFIEGTEVCIPTSNPIIDFCFNEEISTNSSGAVMLVIEVGVILFFEYSKVHGVSTKYVKKNANFNVNYESCSTWCGNNFAFGFKDGTVMTMKSDSSDFNIIDVYGSPIKKIQFCENGLFVLTENGYLFLIKDTSSNEVTECAAKIRNFYVVGQNLLAVIKFDHSISFAKNVNDFEPLYGSSRALPVPDRFSVVSNFLLNNPILLNTGHIIYQEEEDDDEVEFGAGNVDFSKIHSLGNIMSLNVHMKFTPPSKKGQKSSNSSRRTKKGPIQRSLTQNYQIGSSKLVSDFDNDPDSVQISSSSQISEGPQISEDSQQIITNSHTSISDDKGSNNNNNNDDDDENSTSFQSQHAGRSTNYGAYIPTIFNKGESIHPNDRIIPYISKVGRDCWLHLLNRSSLRLMNICALGRSDKYEKTLSDIISLLDYTPSLQQFIFESHLYARKLEEADKVLSKESPNSSTFMLDSIIATSLIAFGEEDEMTDEQLARIRSAGIALIMNNKIKVGGLLLRIAKLDSVAASYMIQAGHPLEAMRFVRSLSSDDEKAKNCFEVAIKYVEKSRYSEATLLFMTSGEYHPALFCLLKLRLVYDAYVIKAFLSKSRMLKEVKGQKALSVPNLLPLKKLCQTIDAQFASLLNRSGVDVQKFKLSIKPRALSTF